MQRLNRASEVVHVLGGIDAVCTMTGASLKAAYRWIGFANMFPARFHDMMIKALRKKGYTAPASLWNQAKGGAKRANKNDAA